MNKYVILVPGLGDHASRIKFATKSWEKYGVIPVIHKVPWKNTKEGFQTKLNRLLSVIDRYAKKGEVSLVGMSAGGSFVINAYLQRRLKIKRIINICGRLREGGFPSLVYAAIGFPAFKTSVQVCEKSLSKLTESDKKKIMTFSPIFDGIVPLSAIPIFGAKNATVPYFFHGIAIALVLILNKVKIISFILQ